MTILEANICPYEHYFSDKPFITNSVSCNKLLLVDDCISLKDQGSLNVVTLSHSGNTYRSSHAYKGLGLVRRILSYAQGNDSEESIYIANSKYLFTHHYKPLHFSKTQLSRVVATAHPYSCQNSFKISQLESEINNTLDDSLNIASTGHTKDDGIRFPASVPDFLSVGVHTSISDLHEQCPIDSERKKPEIALIDANYITTDEQAEHATSSGTSAAVNILATTALLISETKGITGGLNLKAALMCLTVPSRSFTRFLSKNLADKIAKGDFNFYRFGNKSRAIKVLLPSTNRIQKIAVFSRAGTSSNLWEAPPIHITADLVSSEKNERHTSNAWLVLDLDENHSLQEVILTIAGTFSEIVLCTYGEQF